MGHVEKRNSGRRYTPRQSACLAAILKALQSGADEVSMDYLIEEVPQGLLPKENHRQSILSTMKSLEDRLRETNIVLINKSPRGRGNMARWRIR